MSSPRLTDSYAARTLQRAHLHPMPPPTLLPPPPSPVMCTMCQPAWSTDRPVILVQQSPLRPLPLSDLSKGFDGSVRAGETCHELARYVAKEELSETLRRR